MKPCAANSSQVARSDVIDPENLLDHDDRARRLLARCRLIDEGGKFAGPIGRLQLDLTHLNNSYG